MRAEIIKLRERIDTTFIYVTHDQTEAMTLGDRIVIMRDGYIQQIGTPQEVFNNPRNLFVAGFIGSPRMNFITGAEAAKYDAHTIGIRPEHISVGDGPWEGVVGLSEHLGSDSFIKVEVPGLGTINVRGTGELDIHHGDRIRLAAAGKIHRFDDKGLAL